MDKYFGAYNDVEDDLEDAEENIIKETKDEEHENIKLEEEITTTKTMFLEEGEGNDNVNTIIDTIESNGQIDYSERNDEEIKNEISERKDVEDYESKEEDEEDDDFLISDDDQDFFRLKKRPRDDTIEENQENKLMILQPKIKKRTLTSRLVSYGEDEDEDDVADQPDTTLEEEDVVYEKSDFTTIMEGTIANEIEKDNEVSKTIEKLDDLTQHVKLPLRVATKCPKAMQDKVTFLHKKITLEGMDLNFNIQGKKNFRNPSIYEKLLEYCRIDEQGTNYPPHLYNPAIFGPESNYKVLAENQNENEKKKKELKQKRALEKSQAKKTSKWDNPVANIINNLNNNNNNNNNNKDGEEVGIKKVPSVGNLIKTKSS